jgi:hypothetical protein
VAEQFDDFGRKRVFLIYLTEIFWARESLLEGKKNFGWMQPTALAA